MRIGIVAALPGELQEIVKAGFRAVPTGSRTTKKWVGGAGQDLWIAVCAGMGAGAVWRAFAEAEAEGPLDRVLSVGWAGALNDTLPAGESFVAGSVVDAQTGERFELAGGQPQGVLVSTARVVNEPEKRRLAATYGGSMVDMEAATVVRLAQMRGIPVCCVKGISDEVGARLPDFNLFINPLGQIRMGAFLSYVLVRPGYWGALMRLRRTSARAAASLASAVSPLLICGQDVTGVNRTGSVVW